MTPLKKRIAEMRARLDAATPGPFTANEFGPKYPGVWCKDKTVILFQKGKSDALKASDTELFAHAPTDLALALDALEVYERALEIAQNYCDAGAVERGPDETLGQRLEEARAKVDSMIKGKK